LVLIIDDDGPILESLGEILVDEGYALATARDGREALAYLAANPAPACILLDVMMPVMNGYEFRRQQLRDPRLAPIPTLLLTAGHVDGRVAELRLSGWLRKPINLPLLLASLEQHCRAELDGPPPFAGHQAHFYVDEARLLERASAHLGQGLAAGHPAIAVCTAAHGQGLRQQLSAAGLDVQALQAQGRLIEVDAEDVIALLDAERDATERFERVREFLLGLLGRARRDAAAGPVWVFGEVVNLLWRAGRSAEAIQLEAMWNRVGEEQDLALLCSYDSSIRAGSRDVDAVCRQHVRLIRDLA
jgi:CheY-like chemotaxis protein